MRDKFNDFRISGLLSTAQPFNVPSNLARLEFLDFFRRLTVVRRPGHTEMEEMEQSSLVCSSSPAFHHFLGRK